MRHSKQVHKRTFASFASCRLILLSRASALLAKPLASHPHAHARKLPTHPPILPTPTWLTAQPTLRMTRFPFSAAKSSTVPAAAAVAAVPGPVIATGSLSTWAQRAHQEPSAAACRADRATAVSPAGRRAGAEPSPRAAQRAQCGIGSPPPVHRLETPPAPTCVPKPAKDERRRRRRAYEIH